MPSVILFARGEVVSVPSLDGTLYSASFRVPPSQIRQIAPAYYERLKDKETVSVFVCHADAAGNIKQDMLEIADALKPDVMFCCYPTYARRNYPRFPIVGHSGRTVTIFYDEGFESRVIRIVFKED